MDHARIIHQADNSDSLNETGASVLFEVGFKYPTTVVIMAHDLVTLLFKKGIIQGRYSTMPILLKRLSCEQLLVIKKRGKHLHLRDHSSSTLALSYLLIKPFGHSISFLSSFLKWWLECNNWSRRENQMKRMKWEKWSIHLGLKGLGGYTYF